MKKTNMKTELPTAKEMLSSTSNNNDLLAVFLYGNHWDVAVCGAVCYHCGCSIHIAIFEII